MTWRGTDGRFMTPDQFRDHVAKLDFSGWKPIGVVWHNTASPTLKRWHEFSRKHWMDGLTSYYQGLGWQGGPHLFCDDGPDGIGLFTPLNMRGTHSPSFNAQYIGIEHVGDYDSEDDDTGAGLRVKQNGIAATAIICARLGIPIDPVHIKLHKEDTRTTHDCPGRDMAQDKLQSIQAVLEYAGDGGDHNPDWGHAADHPPIPQAPVTGNANVADLNVRASSSAASAIVGVLGIGAKVVIIGEAKNGNTSWLRIEKPGGWVAARFITVST